MRIEPVVLAAAAASLVAVALALLVLLRRRRDDPDEDSWTVEDDPSRVDPLTVMDRYLEAKPVSAGAATNDGYGTRSGPADAGGSGSRERLTIPPRASVAGELPPDDAPGIEGVRVPVGRRRGAGRSALWCSDQPSDDARSTWLQLAARFSQTGLWPVLLDPVESGWIDRLDSGRSMRIDSSSTRDAAAVLAERLVPWQQELTPGLAERDPGYHAELTHLLETHAARGAPISSTGRAPDALARATSSTQRRCIAVASCTRPAALLDHIGWSHAGSGHVQDDALQDVLGSWEERWGALLLALGEGELTLLVTRPPANEGEAREAAAEQLAACPQLAERWDGFDDYARSLLGAVEWRLSWRPDAG